MQEGSLKSRIEQLARQMRLPLQRAVRDGWLASAAPTATPTSPASARPNASCSSTRSSRAERERDRSGAGARAGPLQAASRDPAHAVDFRRQPGVPRAAGLCEGQGLVLRGPGLAYPATNAMALVLFVLVVPVFTFLLQPLVAMYSRKHEFEADAYAAQLQLGARAGQRAGQAVQGQCVHADARPAALGFLRFASAGQLAHLPPRDAVDFVIRSRATAVSSRLCAVALTYTR